MVKYRNGIRVGLWLLAVLGGLAGVSLIVWGLLSALGDESGAVVARVLVLVWGSAVLLDLLGLVALLACIQLKTLERDRSPEDE